MAKHSPINPRNDAHMVNEGLRAPKLIKDPNVFRKTQAEKDQLRSIKLSCFDNYRRENPSFTKRGYKWDTIAIIN